MSSASTSAIPQTSSSASILAGVTSELDRLSPRIDIRPDQIRVLEGPKEFYETLKTKIRNAKQRIYLSSLYIGSTEHELVSCIREALSQNPKLEVSILTDALRGTREDPKPSCASLLAALASEFPKQVEIRMYHTPNLTGLRKRLIPKRINEGWGLQHMKLYGIDEEVILSGANLSNDYFTNRQDRYHVFSSKRVSDYFSGIHHAMCGVSFLLQPGGGSAFRLEWPSENSCPSPLENPHGYIEASRSIFKPFIEPRPDDQRTKAESGTSIYPLLIIPQVLNNELPSIKSLFTAPLSKQSKYLFTAGYFNPHPDITNTLLSCSKNGTHGTVVTASPWANGFYGSKGVSGLLPPAYTLLSRRFLQAAAKLAPGAVELREWRLGTVGRPHGWTYHAKGLWLTLGSDSNVTSPINPAQTIDGPSVTVIGSSNYTVRSYSLDTEVGAVLVTDDAELKKRLRKEEENLLMYSKAVTEQDLQGGERRVGLGVRLAMWMVRVSGGSL